MHARRGVAAGVRDTERKELDLRTLSSKVKKLDDRNENGTTQVSDARNQSSCFVEGTASETSAITSALAWSRGGRVPAPTALE